MYVNTCCRNKIKQIKQKQKNKNNKKKVRSPRNQLQGNSPTFDIFRELE